MTADGFEVTLTCLNCGTPLAQSALPSLSDPERDNTLVSCQNCGFVFGKTADIEAQARDSAVADLRSLARRKLSNLKWIKFD